MSKDRMRRRSELLTIAGQIFLEQGYAGASMSTIAAAAAGSKGTLYNHFASKKDIFLAFMTREIEARVNIALEPLGEGLGLRDTLSMVGERYVRLLTDPMAARLVRLVVHESVRFPEIGDMFMSAGPRQTRQKLREYLDRNIELGMVIQTDTVTAADQFLALCQGRMFLEFLCAVRAPPRKDEIDSLVKAAVSTFLAAYGASASDQPARH